jgi:hypothetical protein
VKSFETRFKLLCSKVAVCRAALETEPLSEDNENPTTQQYDGQDDTDGDVDILNPNSCDPWWQREDEHGGAYVAHKGDTNHSISDDLDRTVSDMSPEQEANRS